jgi:hypothetical protein
MVYANNYGSKWRGTLRLCGIAFYVSAIMQKMLNQEDAKLTTRRHKGDLMRRLNCWEYKKCGRQPGGYKSAELGICPVTTLQTLHGVHGGENAGRACWAIAGSLCGGKIQGTFAQKLNNCWRCEFMNLVKKEEEPGLLGFSYSRLGMEKSLEKMQKSGKDLGPSKAIVSPRHQD